MIKNLSQLKRELKEGTCFEITGHCRPECVGQKRKVTVTNTQGFYSMLPDEPGSSINLANNGRGSVLWWGKSSFWEFKDGICSLFSSEREHTEKYLIISFRLKEKEAA
ncbi:hypothetical protein [Enterocloster alcoholdehydrogenati]|uniref:Uncharacterized protein n=1 Tax=Enterocloster alcoholdehydrogenati TaxID=2547410 RepID=A0ABQ0AZB9_9FIRM